MKLTLKNILLVIFTFILSFNYLLSTDKDKYCRVRLPNTINSYQPTIVPVITIDGNQLYIDRARHPENTGSINDIDEIWVAKRIRKDDLKSNEETQLPVIINNPGLNSDDERDIYFGNPLVQPVQADDETIDKIYEELTKNGDWFEPENAGNVLNTRFSDVLFSITPDGNKALVYGIYNQYDDSKEAGFSISHKINGEWTLPKPMMIRNYYNNTRRRAKNYYGNLSANARTLLLAVNRYDSKGGLDLYVSFRKDTSDVWTEPLSLGDVINSPEDEACPFLAYDNKSLYFASAGHGGYGQFDLFVSRRLDDSWTNWSKPQNLGKAVNTKFDDLNIYLSALGDTAYIVSTDTVSQRTGIYYACLPDSLQPYPYVLVHGYIYGLNNNIADILKENVSFTVNYKAGTLPETYYSNTETGKYYFVLPADTVHTILVEKHLYNPNYSSIDTRNFDKPSMLRKDLILRPLKKQEGILITKVNYDTDIDSLSAGACDIITKFIAGIKHPNRRKYLIVGHADDNGSDLYNLQLSMRRADIAAKYLESLGILPENIRKEWRGEVQPVSDSDTENRRVEIFVE